MPKPKWLIPIPDWLRSIAFLVFMLTFFHGQVNRATRVHLLLIVASVPFIFARIEE
jgi:hypothetical protein